MPFSSQSRAGAAFVMETDKVRLRYLDDGKPFHRGNLVAMCPVSGKEIWHPGQVGRLRTL